MYRLIASAYTRITAHGVAADDNSDVRQILYLVQTLYCANSDPIDTHTRMNNICIFFSLAENGSAINHVEFIFSPFDHPTIFVWTSPTEKIKINAKKNKKKKYSAHHYEINHRARPVEIICKSINRFCICVFSGGHHFSPNVWHQFIDGATRLWIAFKMHLRSFALGRPISTVHICTQARCVRNSLFQLTTASTRCICRAARKKIQTATNGAAERVCVPLTTSPLLAEKTHFTIDQKPTVLCLHYTLKRATTTAEEKKHERTHEIRL